MHKLIQLIAGLFIVAGLQAQTPVPMASQPSLTYTENFSDIANWTNGFASGTGANRFGAVAINATRRHKDTKPRLLLQAQCLLLFTEMPAIETRVSRQQCPFIACNCLCNGDYARGLAIECQGE